MFLTRLGFGSRAVITGDTSQVDLPRGHKSGLTQALKILANIDDIHITEFNSRDVVRHHLVQKIIDAYDAHDLIESQAESERANIRKKQRQEQELNRTLTALSFLNSIKDDKPQGNDNKDVQDKQDNSDE